MLRLPTFPSSAIRSSLALALALLVAPLLSREAAAQERTLTVEQFEDASLQYRTALHYDPLLEAPLDGLIRLYREADRMDELVGLYRSHIEQYSDDAGAKSVLIQILNRDKREGAGELVTSAVTLHPQFPALQYLQFRFLEGKGDERALDSLSRAIDLETNVARRSQWLEELLQLSEGDEARKLAGTQLTKLLAIEGQSSANYLTLAKLMQRYLFWDLSLEAIKQASAGGLTPDGEIEASVMQATALLEIGRGGEAAAVLDQLLGKLAGDHWRRREILSMRLSVVATAPEREEIIAKFKKAHDEQPESETAALDYAEILIASEKQSEAIRIILNAATKLSSSRLIESRALELLLSGNDPRALEAFLEERLEVDPERADLRFQLVKVRYALGKDAGAEQDFKVVVAGLEPAELSDRILELQRYLRSIDRVEAAGVYLERYVRNYPDRLDVARELAEVFVSRENHEAVDPLIATLDVTSATSESVADLAGFLISEGFFASARSVLSKRIAAEPFNFELGLMLIEVYGELGDEDATLSFAPRMREIADSPERYARWLEATVTANTQLETLDRFFTNEQARFSFDSGEWPEDKVEKFVLLCEAGKLKLQVETIALAVRTQLESGTFDTALKTRLRKFLVGMLEVAPAASLEVETQLKALAEEDPANRPEYDLQRALLYHRTQRIDLSQSLLTTIAFSEIQSPKILQEAIEILVGYGYLRQAAEALAVVNKLLPEDVFSWERRLTLLASLNRESDFRAVVRQLRGEDAPVTLREDSLTMLDDHLQASFWRSVSRLIATGDPNRFEETLPLLASVDREDQSLTHAAWTEWTRSIVLRTLGREEEASEALNRLNGLLEEQKIALIEFPDGLTLDGSNASALVMQTRAESRPQPGFNATSLLTQSGLGWAFEVEPGARIEQFARSGDLILVLDNRGTVYSLDQKSGKLLWRERLVQREQDAGRSRPGLFITRPDAPRNDSMEVKNVRPFLVGDDRFFILTGNHLKAFSSLEGELIWSAQLKAGPPAEAPPSEGARPDTLMDMADGKLVVFRPDEGAVFSFDSESGKQLWESRVWKEQPEGLLTSLNAGLDVTADRVFAYGWQSVVLDVATGQPFWGFDRSFATTFPVTLRKERGENPGEEIPVESGTPTVNRLVDFTRSDLTSGFLSSLENERLSMVSPAVHWTRERLQEGTESYAVIADGFLWLMQDKALRRLSLRLPVASRHLPASGTFLGVVKNHAWFLDGQTLHHLDFNTERVSQINLSDLGSSLRAVLSGNQLVVRGQVGAKVVNALTGSVIGTHAFPPELLAHLKAVTEVRPYEARAESLWRGSVFLPENGEPRYCLPIQDSISEDSYVTQFGGNVLVSFKSLAEPVASTGGNTDE
ncbi:MAG: PQQ-binding-like beta-propeller repeat protein [Verrucomicrobiales bacterium]|nr:PQQ-binding-like beta-propeller repeat protein [Verrucomicrobiales bacterium]